MIQSIRLQNFRSYVDDSFEFEAGVNIIVGPNGSGKTNLLEAILTSCIGSSYRAKDDELVQFEKNWSRIDTANDSDIRTLKISLENGRLTKNYVFEEKPYKILTLKNTLPVVLFEPNHLQLLHGQPEQRRLYMDNLLEQTIPEFKNLRKQYRRVLTQRNALLKSHNNPPSEQFFVWNLRLSELGGVIARHRNELINEIQLALPSLYNEIAGNKKTDMSIKYVSKLPIDNYETTLMQALENSLEQDKIRGFTSYGPHRDDFLVSYNGHPAAEVASRGETRTTLLALKVFELQLLENQRGQKPLLLLDDVFSELDGKRRHLLTDHLQRYQTFITTTDADVVVQTFLNNCRVIPLG